MGWVSARDMDGGGGVRLFCLPHAGSGAAAFYRWKRVLPEQVRVCPVLLPGREQRLGEDSARRVSAIVGGLQAEVAGELARPYAVFGHSMGALLAFEWVRRIAADGLPPPVKLFVSGRNAPQLMFGHRELHKLGDERFVEELHVRYGGVPEGFLEDAELREVFLPILRADIEVVETYEFGDRGRLGCAVMGFAGAADRSVSEVGLAAWGEVTDGTFSSRRFLGDHFYHLAGGAGQAELMRVIAQELGYPPTWVKVSKSSK